jgi:hypothetical protein
VEAARVGVIYTKSPIDLTAAVRISSLVSSREVHFGDVSLAELLYYHGSRVQNGVVVDRWAESKSSVLLGTKGNLEVYPDREGSDPRLAECDLGYLRGRSVFAERKIVRYIFRCGSNLTEYDLENSHFSCLVEGFVAETADLPCLLGYVRNRDDVLCTLRSLLNHGSEEYVANYKAGLQDGGYSRDDVKRCLLSLGYGGSIERRYEEKSPRGCRPAFFIEFARELAKLAWRVSSQRQDLYSKVYAMKTEEMQGASQLAVERKARFVCLSHVAAELQRAVTDRMVAAAGLENVASFERDGIVCTPNASADAIIAAARS